MRRKTTIIAITTALAVLVGAASAFAAFNTYTASYPLTSNKAGSSGSPSALGFTENFAATGTSGNRTAALTDIKTTIYGLVTNGKDFPTCSLAKIANAKSDSGCPKGAMVASGSITAVLGPANNPSQSAAGLIACAPKLHVWNAGQGKVVYFFISPASAHLCGPITTGLVGPYPGTLKQQGKNLVLNTPVPSYVSFPEPGFEGSLEGEHLVWPKLTTKVAGKTVAYAASVACKKGKRPYSTSFTAVLNGSSETGSVSGSVACK
ncbi:MAG: hypothetical protein ABSG43_11785 [Solirubrobacteraceae bacterium]